MSKQKNETPLMKQYNKIKSKYPDAMLLFRVGDFYETFGEDAIKASKVLDITLTSRNNGSNGSELAGFPYHSINNYLPKLVKAGYRVAICDQLEDPKLTKTIVKRGVTELVTPGVTLNEEILQAKKNNFLASVYVQKSAWGVSFLDISTGEFLMAQGDSAYIDKLFQNFAPSEILVGKGYKREFLDIFGDDFNTFFLEDWVYKWDYAFETLTKQFGTTSLKGFGVEEMEEGVISAGAVLYYLLETNHTSLSHISSISRIFRDEYVWLDKFTIRNLEIYPRESGQIGLVDVVDRTISPMGSRTLRRWLSLPLNNISKILKRHDVVEFFIKEEDKLERVRRQIKQITDIERLISKVATGRISPREVVMLGKSLKAIIPIKELLMSEGSGEIVKIAGKIVECNELIERIEGTLWEDAPVSILKGDAIRDGFSQELDELRQMSHSTKGYLEQMLQKEMESTGISSLKIDNNNVFGYYFEVRNTHKDKVPANWVRKQTLVSAERYITPELKEFETKIIGAQERIMELEGKFFAELVQDLVEYIGQIKINALVVGEIDTLCSFSSLSKERNYVRPEVNEGYEIEIKGGRHPVIEQMLPPQSPFIANDIFLDREGTQIMMITGPNMSGKSAILRQTALIVILSQIGCFVPADSARLGLVDKIFTRVGASDNISQGESTFMVEMNEAALILNNISDRSLILLDEIGRGTSTYDGISIAWAIAEYLHTHPSRPKTLFATHYHELNEMTNSFERIKNYNVSVKETDDSVLFLRKLVEGGSEHSFGIQVAKMAGMPAFVIEKANKILKRLEDKNETGKNNEAIASRELQLSIFSQDEEFEKLKDEILEIDINTYTPMDALIKLNELKNKILKKKNK